MNEFGVFEELAHGDVKGEKIGDEVSEVGRRQLM